MDKKTMKSFINTVLAVLIPVGLFLILHFLIPNRVNQNNVGNLLSQAILPSILAMGLTFNILVGNWDFAIGAEVQLAAILGGNLAAQLHLGIPGMIALCVLIGAVLGALNGGLHLLLKAPTLITSIGFLLILESVSALIYNGAGYRGGAGLLVLGVSPQNHIIFTLIFAAMFYICNYRPLGSWVKAVGKNPAIAKNNGINVGRVKFLSIFTAGVFAGLYAFMHLGTNSTVRVMTEMGTMVMAFEGMMCVFIGIALASLTNLILGVYLGALILQIVKLGLIVLRIPTELTQIIIALFVLIFMAYSGARDKAANRVALKYGARKSA